jgi:hypothetical protein
VKKVKESAIEAELIRRVEEIGGIAEKVTVIGRRGFFDRLIVLPGGETLYVEVKRPKGGRISKHQRARHAKYSDLGARVAIVKTMADIDLLLSP